MLAGSELLCNPDMCQVLFFGCFLEMLDNGQNFYDASVWEQAKVMWRVVFESGVLFVYAIYEEGKCDA